MQQKLSIGERVFKHIQPHLPSLRVLQVSWPDPTDWDSFVALKLIPEVRAETLRFYGPNFSLEKSCPGLDYNSKWHRRRLRQFHCHRLLFDVIDRLDLTRHEVYHLASWRNSLYSRNKWEAAFGVTIQDTIGDDVPAWVEPQRSASVDVTSMTGVLEGGEAGDHGLSGETPITSDDTVGPSRILIPLLRCQNTSLECSLVPRSQLQVRM